MPTTHPHPLYCHYWVHQILIIAALSCKFTVSFGHQRALEWFSNKPSIKWQKYRPCSLWWVQTGHITATCDAPSFTQKEEKEDTSEEKLVESKIFKNVSGRH